MLLLLTGGCSGQIPPPSFSVEPDHTKIFFYPAYDNDDDKPYFDETFWLTVDGYTPEGLGVDQYVEIDALPPGDHILNVDEVSWAGETLNHATMTVHLEAGKAQFVVGKIVPNTKAEKNAPKKKISLSKVEAPLGEGEIKTRTRKCFCKNLVQELF